MNPSMQNPKMAKLLQQVNGIIEPNSHFELAIGWWILIFLGTLLTALTLFLFFYWHRKNRYRRIALVALHDLPQTPDSQYLVAINRLLKQVAIKQYGRKTIAPLYGHHWIAWLDQHKGKTAFQDSVKAALGDAAYQDEPEFNPEAIEQFARSWIKHHPAAKQGQTDV